MLSGGVRDVAVRLTLDAASFVKDSGLARDIVSEIAQQFDAVDKAINRVQRTMGVASASLVAIGGISTFTAVEWESSFTAVEKTVNGTAEQLDGVGDSMRKLSTEKPITADQLASLGGMAGQLGVAREAIDEYAETAAMLGSATDMSSEQAIFALSRLMGVMNEAESSIDAVGAALTYAGNTMKATEGEILDFSTNIAGTANTVGIAVQDVIALSGAFASAGIEAEAGGTAVQKVFLSMNQAATIGGAKLAAFSEALGMTRDEFQKLFRENPTEAFVQVVERIAAEGERGQAILQRLGIADQRQIRAFLNVANASGQVRAAVEGVNNAYMEGTALAEEAGRRYGTVASEFQRLANVGKEVRRSIGETFVPALGMVVDLGADTLNLFNQLPGPIKGTIGVLGGVAAVGLAAGAGMLQLGQALGFSALAFQALRSTVMGAKVFGFIQNQAKAAAVALARFAGARGIAGVAAALKKLPGAGLNALKSLAMMSWAGLAKLPGILMTGARAATRFVGSLHPATLAVAALGTAALAYNIYAAKQRDALRTSAEAAHEYADAFGAAYQAVAQVASQESAAPGVSVDEQFAQKMANQIQQIKNLKAEARDVVIMEFALELARGGASPEEVMTYIEGLRRETDTPAQFEVEYDDLMDFNGQLQIAEERLRLMRGELEDQSRWGHAARQIADGLKNIFSGDFTNNASGLTSEMLEDLESRAISLQRLMSTGAEGTAEATLEFNKFAEAIEGLRPNVASDAVSEMIESLEGMEGFEPNLDNDALRDAARKGADALSDEFARQLQKNLGESLLPKGVDLQDEKAVTEWLNNIRQGAQEASKATSDQTRLMQYLGEEYANLEKAEQSRMLAYKLSEMEAQYGTQVVLDMLDEEINKRREVGDVASEEFAKLRTEREKLADKIFQQTERELEGLIDEVSPIEAMRAINDAIAELDQTAEKYWDRMQKFVGMRNQILDTAKNNLIALVEEESRLYDARAEIAADANQRIAEIERDATERLVEAQEDRNEALAEAAESHKDDLAKAQQDRNERLKDARMQLDEELRQINETYEQRLREQGQELAQWASLTERVFTEASMSPETLIQNIERQQEQFRKWQQGLAQLRKRGLSEDAISMIGLDEDPRQLAQVEQLARASDAQLQKLNKQISTREKEAMAEARKNNGAALAEAEESRKKAREQFAKSSREIEADFAKTTAEMNRKYASSVAEIKERHSKTVADIHKDTRRSIQDVNRQMREDLQKNAEELAKLGSKSGMDFGEALEKGMRSKNKHIRKAAQDVTKLMEEASDNAAKGVDKIMRESIRAVDKRVGGWSSSIVEEANRVLDAVGGKPIKMSGKNRFTGGSKPGNRGGGGGGGSGGGSFQAGGPIEGGAETGDVVPIMAEPGEFVMPRSSVNKYGRNFMEQIQKKSFQIGGEVGVDWQPKLKMQQGGIVKLGREIERMGYDVGEHPAFGGVAPVHTPNSWHYKRAALDINWYPANEEPGRLNALARWIKRRIEPRELFWPANDPVGGHSGHLHVAWPGGGSMSDAGSLSGAELPDTPDLSKFGKAIGHATEAVLEHVREAVVDYVNEHAPYGIVEGLEGYEGSSGELKRMVKSLAKKQEGWGDNQWPALNRLVQKESSWNPNAQNPTSTAYGLFQFLDATWKTVGATKTSDPYKQSQAGLQYIDQRYGTPTSALAFHNRNNWYAAGGIFDRPQVIGVGERGREAVLPLQGRGIGVLAEALRAAMGAGAMGRVTQYSGPITVQAQDPAEMERKLQRRRRVNSLSDLRT